MSRHLYTLRRHAAAHPGQGADRPGRAGAFPALRLSTALCLALVLGLAAPWQAAGDPTRNRIGNSANVLANVDVLYNVCLQHCAQSSEYRMALESCEHTCAELRRTFPLRDKGYSTYESCAKAVDNFDLNRDVLEKDAADWCTETWTHIHKRQGCREGTAAFFAAVTQENICMRQPSAYTIAKEPAAPAQLLGAPAVVQTPLAPYTAPAAPATVYPQGQPVYTAPPVTVYPQGQPVSAAPPATVYPQGQPVYAAPAAAPAAVYPQGQSAVDRQARNAATDTTVVQPAGQAGVYTPPHMGGYPDQTKAVATDTTVVLPAGQAYAGTAGQPYAGAAGQYPAPGSGGGPVFVFGPTLVDTPKYQSPEETARTLRRPGKGGSKASAGGGRQSGKQAQPAQGKAAQTAPPQSKPAAQAAPKAAAAPQAVAAPKAATPQPATAKSATPQAAAPATAAPPAATLPEEKDAPMPEARQAAPAPSATAAPAPQSAAPVSQHTAAPPATPKAQSPASSPGVSPEPQSPAQTLPSAPEPRATAQTPSSSPDSRTTAQPPAPSTPDQSPALSTPAQPPALPTADQPPALNAAPSTAVRPAAQQKTETFPGPAAPVVAAPVAPVIIAPTAPGVEAPSVPVIVAPTAPQAAAPQAPARTSPPVTDQVADLPPVQSPAEVKALPDVVIEQPAQPAPPPAATPAAPMERAVIHDGKPMAPTETVAVPQPAASAAPAVPTAGVPAVPQAAAAQVQEGQNTDVPRSSPSSLSDALRIPEGSDASGNDGNSRGAANNLLPVPSMLTQPVDTPTTLRPGTGERQ